MKVVRRLFGYSALVGTVNSNNVIYISLMLEKTYNSFITKNNVVASALFVLGKWSSLSNSGSRPPPCSNFSLTITDEDQAVMFGGYTPSSGKFSEVHDLHLPIMVSYL